LKSPEVSQGVAAVSIGAEVVRRVGVAGASLVAVSAAKTTRSGVAKPAGDWWSRVVVTLSMVALDFLFGCPWDSCAIRGRRFSRYACGFTPACGSEVGPSAGRYETQG